MAVTIKFDNARMPELPTCILSKRNGKHIGVLNTITQIKLSDSLNSPTELSFIVYKKLNGKRCRFWKDIRDLRLLHIPEWKKWFEISVETNEDDNCVKTVTATALCEKELSNIRLFDIEINTKGDIARVDYLPTVLYDPKNAQKSLLDRLLKDKAKHYKIIHVDPSISNIQRTFSFDNISLYDAFQEISEEIHCLFIFGIENNRNTTFRTISVYDLESKCSNCGYRGEFTRSCPKCGSSNIFEGYGKDTSIFTSIENLSESITYSTDIDSVKNCFKLKSGDEDMDAAIINCSPSGSSYMWYFNESDKEDMSEGLVEKLESYDKKYTQYQTNYVFDIDNNIINKYNQLIQKYKIYDETLNTIPIPIKGYASLMNTYYNAIDFSGYLKNTLMPSVKISGTSAQDQAALLTVNNLSPISVENINYISLATANSVILSYAKVYIDTSKYKISVKSSSISGITWTGNFTVTSYSNEEDTTDSNIINIIFNDDYENFTKQKIDKVLAKAEEDLSIVGLFDKNDNAFKDELKKYSLSYLQIFYDSCQSCLDILIEQGISDKSSQTDLYNSLYKPYYDKLGYISQEIQLRENEVNIILGLYDNNGNLTTEGIQSIIEKERKRILNELDFEKYIGEYWSELSSFRREDLWQNDNYISDGLNNRELFEKAEEFLDAARKDLIKSSTLQHTISSTLKNLLIIEDFKPIVEAFSVGNWLRLMVDDTVYKLRLIQYDLDYDNLDVLSVTFSDVVKQLGSISDIQSILKESRSISTSYSSVKYQASQGEESNKAINDWVDKGLDASTVKIINSADGQDIVYDKHGLLCRKYDSITETYSPIQMKMLNNILALTTDNWETSKAGIGQYTYLDPTDGQYKTGYGVIADTIVGNIILGKNVGIYNESGNLTFDENGFSITNGKNSFDVNPNSDKMLSIKFDNTEIFSVDRNIAKINGFSVNNNAFYNGTDSITSETPGIYIGLDGIRQFKNEDEYVDIKDGKLTCVGADIIGNIHCLGSIYMQSYKGESFETGHSFPLIDVNFTTENNQIFFNDIFGVPFLTWQQDGDYMGLWAPRGICSHEFKLNSAYDGQSLNDNLLNLITLQCKNGVTVRSSQNVNEYKSISAKSFDVSSSRLIKENIKDLSEERARKLLDTHVVTFDYIGKVGGMKNQCGVIAEELLNIIPECVNIPEDFDESLFDVDANILLEVPSVNYSGLIPYLIKLIQMQQKEIDSLKTVL